jgi:hypothetical protein
MSEQAALAEWIEVLATEIGPRRPTSSAEREAAELVASRLRAGGIEVHVEPFAGYSTFGLPFAAGSSLAVLAASRRLPRILRLAAGAAAAGALVTEGGLVHTPLSDALSTRPSQNVIGTIEPRSAPRRTLCVVCHLDTSRSGLLFAPRFSHLLHAWLGLQSAALLAAAASCLLDRLHPGRALSAGARLVLLQGLATIAERELRGEDVPGANDNASGVAVAAQLALETATKPLEHTRLVFLATGCEEAGMLGMQALLRSRDTSNWLFLNVDNVGGPATLRYLEREGVVNTWPADAALIEIAARLGRDRPDLGLEPAGGPIGLTYDATPVLARGGRALTLVAADEGVIPNYHQPTDTPENLDLACVGRALDVSRALTTAIDRGEAD